jgi:hypothetical protein
MEMILPHSTLCSDICQLRALLCLRPHLLKQPSPFAPCRTKYKRFHLLADPHLLFWLSLFPFVTGWMGENNFST